MENVPSSAILVVIAIVAACAVGAVAFLAANGQNSAAQKSDYEMQQQAAGMSLARYSKYDGIQVKGSKVISIISELWNEPVALYVQTHGTYDADTKTGDYGGFDYFNYQVDSSMTNISPKSESSKESDFAAAKQMYNDDGSVNTHYIDPDDTYSIVFKTVTGSVVSASDSAAAQMEFDITASKAMNTGGSEAPTDVNTYHVEIKKNASDHGINNHSVQGNGTYKLGDTVTLSAQPNAGYTIDGFYAALLSDDGKNFLTNADGTFKLGAKVTNSFTVSGNTKNIYLIVVSSPLEYTVSYTNMDDATWKDSSKAIAKYNIEGTGESYNGDTITADASGNFTLPIPERDGYTFLGWTLTTTDTVTTFSKNMGADLTFYANWSSNPVSYTVDYDLDGLIVPNASSSVSDFIKTSDSAHPATNSTDNPTAYNISESRVTFSEPTRDNYNFVGWLYSTDGGKTYVNSAPQTPLVILPSKVLSNIKLVACWSQQNLSITFDGNGGATGGTLYRTVGAEIGADSLPTSARKGYIFKGWNTSANGTGTTVTGSYKMPDHSITVYAQWLPITYTVVYNANGGKGTMASQTVKYGTSATASTNTFNKAYNLIYNPMKGAVTPASLVVNCVFKGWNTKADGTGDTVSSILNLCSTDKGSVTLYAIWEPGKVTLPTPTRSGFTFDGWAVKSTEITGDYSAGTQYAVSKDTTLYATWQSTTGKYPTYTVRHMFMDLDGVSYTLHFEATYNDTPAGSTVTPDVLPDNECEGFDSPAAKTITVADDGTSYVNYLYTRKKYSLTVQNGTGATANTDVSGTYFYGQSITVTASPKEGYMWGDSSKWSDGSKDQKHTFTMPAKNYTIYPTAQQQTFTIRYYLNNGSDLEYDSSLNMKVASDQTYCYIDLKKNESIPYPKTTRTGYTFTGWKTTDGTSLSKGTLASADVSYYAQWKINTYTLTVGWTLNGIKQTAGPNFKVNVYADGKQIAYQVSSFSQKLEYGTKYEIEVVDTTGKQYASPTSYSGTIGTSDQTVLVHMYDLEHLNDLRNYDTLYSKTFKSITYNEGEHISNIAFNGVGGWETKTTEFDTTPGRAYTLTFYAAIPSTSDNETDQRSVYAFVTNKYILYSETGAQIADSNTLGYAEIPATQKVLKKYSIKFTATQSKTTLCFSFGHMWDGYDANIQIGKFTLD